MLDSFERRKRRVCEELFRCPAVCIDLERGFRIKAHDEFPDAPRSPILINLRVLRSLPRLLADVADVYGLLMEEREVHPDLLADIPVAVSPIVTALSLATQIPQITPREPKGRGLNSSVEGIFQRGQVAVLCDDLVTRSDSKVQPTNAMREAGLIVRDCVVLIDREQGGERILFDELGLTLHSAFTMRTLLRTGVEVGSLDSATMDAVLEYPRVLKDYIAANKRA